MHVRNMALERPGAAPRLELVHDHPRQDGCWRELLDTFQTLGQAVAICDAAGHRRGVSPALTAVLAAEAERDVLEATIDAVARAARHRGELVESTVAGSRAEYALRACRHGQVAGGPSAIIVVVRQVRRLLPAHSALIARFGLTAAQSRVALLLAGGATNAAVAADLGISPHTAKRHTERVLQRLAVSSRARVLDALMEGAPAAGSTAHGPVAWTTA